MNALLATLNSQYVHSCLALHSLKAQVKHLEDQVRFTVREYTVNGERFSILADVFSLHPDYLFLSLYIWNRQLTLQLLEDIHRVLPDTEIYLGGPEASHDRQRIMADFPAITGIFVGEGEETFRRFWEAKLVQDQQGSDSESLPGLFLRHTPYQSRNPLDMDQLVFAYPPSVLEGLQGKIHYYESSRGCPFHCAYCLSSVDRVLRFKSLTRVEDEISRLARAGVKQVKFVDRTFNTDADRAVAIWKCIRDLPETGTNFHFEVTGDRLSEEALTVLEQMPPGRVQLEIGVQSATEEVLQLCGRKTNLEAIAINVKRLRQAENIHLHLDLIAGLPLETLESFRQSFDWVWRMEPEKLQLGFLKVLKGSPMETLADLHGMKSSGVEPFEILHTDTMNFGELCLLKGAELALESFGNSDLMPATISRYASSYQEGPLAFFMELGGQMEAEKSIKQKYLTVLEWLSTLQDPEEIRSSLLFDWMLTHRQNGLPSFLADECQQTYWLDEIRENRAPAALAAYAPELSPRDMYKALGAMVFTRRIFFQGQWLQEEQQDPVVFDYRKMNKMNGRPEFFTVPYRIWQDAALTKGRQSD